MEILLDLDKYMFKLIEGSGFIVIMLLGVLKVLAKETKWSGDDKIISLFLGMVRAVKRPEKKEKS